jgi:hypothetical protein
MGANFGETDKPRRKPVNSRREISGIRLSPAPKSFSPSVSSSYPLISNPCPLATDRN